MRTFHTGGAAAADDITQGLPRVVELFEARTPKGVAPIAEATGRVEIEDTDKARRILLTPDDGSEQHAYPVSKRSRLVVADGDHVEVGTKLVQGAIDPSRSFASSARARPRSTSSTRCSGSTASRVCRSTTSTSRSSCARCCVA